VIDFDLVLAPAMAAFAQSITLTPTVSQPGAPAYAARGVFDFKAVEIPLDDGTFHSTNQPTLGIRLADYAVAPKQGDLLSMPQGNYQIADVVPDGQGGADLLLRNTGQ
jgi:hypothetical protein